jgi:hypothetical protein
MEQDNLYGVMQNVSLSAIALHSFTLGYYQISKGRISARLYPKLEYMFYVLPIIYHKTSRSVIRNSNELYTAIQKDNTIILGLQERATKMTAQTFDGLNLAFSKKILTYNHRDKTIELMDGFRSNKLPLTSSMMCDDHNIKMMQNCAFRMGNIFAKRNEKNIQIDLNIRF